MYLAIYLKLNDQKKYLLENLENEEDYVLEEANIQELRIKIQSLMIVECTKIFCKYYREILEGTFRGELMERSDIINLKKCCKEMVRPIFDNPEVKKDIFFIADDQYFLPNNSS